MEPARTGLPLQGDAKPQDVNDDGYETSNGGDGAQQKPPAEAELRTSEPSQASEPTQPEPDASPDIPVHQSPEGVDRQPALVVDEKSCDKSETNVSSANMDESEAAVRECETDNKCEMIVDKEETKDCPEKALECHDETELPFPDTMERDGETRMEGINSASNSPKRLNESLNPDESSVSRDNMPSSPCPSNSRSNSSLGAPRQQSLPFDSVESVHGHMMPVHQEDSSSQSQSYPPPSNLVRSDQLNPYDLKNRLPQPYMQVRGPDMGFGGIKREPYDMTSAEHDPYVHYKRENDPYCRDIDPYGRYKRPDEMFMNSFKEDLQYQGFGAIKRDQNPYAMKCDPYAQHPFSGGIKREHEPDMLGYNGIKRECSEDPYSFVDEDAAMCAMLSQGNPAMLQGTGNPLQGEMMVAPHMMQNVPKKRGRKKKIKDECLDIKQEGGLDGGPIMAIAKPIKERKKHDRFNGMSEEEVCRRTLPDHLAQNLDIIIIGINPGLFAAYKGHHYAGPGNHFWKCLYLSGLTQEQMSADEDYKLLHFGIGFTNMVQRATKGSADLTRKEIKEGSQILLEKLQTFRPKIAVFNGKLIYEVFSGKKDFCFGRQPDTVHGTNTYMWVMPSSSARCAQLPRAADKVPFYSALRRFRDYLNGAIAHVDDSELVFPDTTCRRAHEDQEIRRLIGPDLPCETMVLEDGTEVPVKKKRGRPKKVKLENGEVVPPTPRAPRAPKQSQQDCLNGEQPPKKKRGRPKKVRPEEQQYLQQQQQTNTPSIPQVLPNMPLNQSLNLSQQNMDNQYQQNIHNNRDYQQATMALDAATGMMYQNPMNPNTNQSLGNGGSVQSQSQNLPVNVPSGPATSPYFQSGLPNPNVNPNSEQSPGLDNSQQPLGAPGTPGSIGNIPRAQPGYGQSPGPFSQSPRPHGGVGYGSSPRPAGYSQSPQRHQGLPPSYSNSPVPQQGQTPHPYSQSPVPQNPNTQYSQSPPLRPHSQNHNYSQASPLSGHPYSRSPIPQNNTPTYSQQSPMFAQSPANMPHPYSQSPVPQGQGFSQPSPASQSLAYACRSPAPMGHSYPQSPLSQGASYPQLSPAQQGNPSHPYSQSPIPQNTGMYSQSPIPQSQSYQHSPSIHSRSHPYSPVPIQSSHNLPHHSVYGQSPLHQTQSRHNPVYSPPQNMSMNSNASNPPLPHQQYHTELSTEISAAISSPGPASPSIGHIDFEPPILESQMHVQETETNSSTHSISQRTSPGGDQMTANDLRQNTGNMNPESALNAMGDVSHASSHDSNDLMDTCTNPMLQMPASRQHGNQNRHSALNLIGPSSSSNTSSPIPSSIDPTKGNIDMSRNYTNAMYTQSNSNEAQSPVSNEQRLGFQVPTPSGSANSSYGTATPVAADLSNVPRNSPRDVDNASVASVSSQHERLGSVGGPGGYPLGSYPGEAGGSPRQQESSGILSHHAASMYGNPFTRMGSTPPSHHPLSVGGSQPSPFSSQSGGGAFRGLPLDASQGSPQSLSVQGSSGQPVDYGSPVKSSSTTTKQQDVSSKSLSGLESLVDQIPSIADGGPALSSDVAPHTGPAPVPTLENPYAAHAPSLYSPYSPYQPTPYGPPPVSNNGYSSALAAGSFVGYPGSPYGQLMRPTPGYLPEALSAYHPHTGYPGIPAQQYAPGGGYGPAGPPPNYSAYYNGYGPASIQNAAANMPTYLSSHVLDHIHKNATADASSVSFGGFC